MVNTEPIPAFKSVDDSQPSLYIQKLTALYDFKNRILT